MNNISVRYWMGYGCGERYFRKAESALANRNAWRPDMTSDTVFSENEGMAGQHRLRLQRRSAR